MRRLTLLKFTTKDYVYYNTNQGIRKNTIKIPFLFWTFPYLTICVEIPM